MKVAPTLLSHLGSNILSHAPVTISRNQSATFLARISVLQERWNIAIRGAYYNCRLGITPGMT
jgi:hypothetical protein